MCQTRIHLNLFHVKRKIGADRLSAIVSGVDKKPVRAFAARRAKTESTTFALIDVEIQGLRPCFGIPACTDIGAFGQQFPSQVHAFAFRIADGQGHIHRRPRANAQGGIGLDAAEGKRFDFRGAVRRRRIPCIGHGIHTGRLSALLGERIGVFADVPYRIAAYADLLRDPKNTVRYDHASAAKADERTAHLGADGKLVASPEGGLLYTSLAEKLLLPLCVKASNLVPGGGIWLNTQRPEWNDANNALVGQGLSMVTTAQMRRHALLLQELVAAGPEHVEGTKAFGTFMRGLSTALPSAAGAAVQDPLARRKAMDALGGLGEAHRKQVYAYMDTAQQADRRDASMDFRPIDRSEIIAFLERLVQVLDETLQTAAREDGLYHAYNRMALRGDGGVEVHHYYPMLEGQVAMLSSGLLDAQQAIDCLEALRSSALYREDQNSYLLYPDRDVPDFLDANRIPEARVQDSAVLQGLLDGGGAASGALVLRDAEGHVRFAPRFRNAADLVAACRDAGLDTQATEALAEHWEAVFQHAEFTGRSGTFFGYEGLGSIYWHMVSKLLLAVQECWQAAVLRHGADDPRSAALATHYRAIRSGIGWEQEPAVYGAFHTDPYSHTPAGRGAQQPGMTGQVKEDILCRWGELGVTMAGACIAFDQGLLRSRDLLAEQAVFQYPDAAAQDASCWSELPLKPGQLAFTLCGVPVRYQAVDAEKQSKLTVHFADGRVEERQSLALSTAESRQVFARTGEIRLLEVFMPFA